MIFYAKKEWFDNVDVFYIKDTDVEFTKQQLKQEIKNWFDHYEIELIVRCESRVNVGLHKIPKDCMITININTPPNIYKVYYIDIEDNANAMLFKLTFA